MSFLFTQIDENDLEQYKSDMQEAFQKWFEEDFGKTEEIVLPVKDIDMSLQTKGSIVYKAVIDSEMVGGAIVVIDEETQHNHLDFLYVKYGIQSKGIGKRMWDEIEKLHPQTKIWETCTPYFEKRNIHFYVNKCGFHIVEYQCKYNHTLEVNEDFIGDGNEGMFRFQKKM